MHQALQDAGFPVGIQADELNWVDTFGFDVGVRARAREKRALFPSPLLNIWADGGMNERMNGGMNGGMNAGMNERMNTGMDERMNGGMNAGMDERMNAGTKIHQRMSACGQE